jgi:hypothetical protein
MKNILGCLGVKWGAITTLILECYVYDVVIKFFQYISSFKLTYIFILNIEWHIVLEYYIFLE